MFIDTHCHLNLITKKDFNDSFKVEDFYEIEKILKKSKEKGVISFITIGTTVDESLNCINIAKRFKEVFSVVGIHPCDATNEWEDEFKKIEVPVMKRETKIVRSMSNDEIAKELAEWIVK